MILYYKIGYTFIQCSWGALQSLAGFLLYLYCRIRQGEAIRSMYQGSICTCWRSKNGISLGLFIFAADDEMKKHEYGHTLQSLLLGPLYLLVIGLPSFIWANLPYFQQLRKKKNIDYYSFWTERWANHLADCFEKKSEERRKS